MTDTTTKTATNRKPRQEKLARGVRRRGNSMVIYLTYPDGRIERRSLGNVTPKFADDQRRIFQREIAEGRYIKPVPRVEQVLFRTIADKAVEHAKKYKRCWGTDEQRAKVFKDWWGDRPADSITATEIDAKLTENLAPKGSWCRTTWNEYRVCLSHIYALAIDREELSRNPVAKLKPFKLENARTRELSADEEQRLRLAIRKLYPKKEVELDVLLHTGARISNWYGVNKKDRLPMAPLQWSAVNLDWKIVTFPRSKSGVGYQIPLNEVAVKALNQLLERSPEGEIGPVIRKPSGLELRSARKWFEESCKDAGIVDLHLHDLRHTFATRLRRNKVPLEDIAALLGHDLKKHSMTARYAHPDLDVLREAVNTLVPKNETGTKTDTPTVVEFRKSDVA